MVICFSSASNPKFIIFPKQSASFVNVMGFLLEALFFWTLASQFREASIAHTIIIWVTASCALLSFIEALTSTDRGSPVRFILLLVMCLQSSWIVHSGLKLLFKVCGLNRNGIWTRAVHLILSSHLNFLSGILGPGEDHHPVGMSCLRHHDHGGHHRLGHEHHRPEPHLKAR